MTHGAEKPGNPGNLSRARPEREDPPVELAGFRDVDVHVYRIAQRMAALQWERGVSAGEYAATYGISESRVDNWAAEAARYLRLTGLASSIRAKAWMVVDRVMEAPEDALALAAARVALERVDSKATGYGSDSGANSTDEARRHRVVTMFSDPDMPIELVEIITTHWGPRTVFPWEGR